MNGIFNKEYDAMRKAWEMEHGAFCAVGAIRQCTTQKELDNLVMAGIKAVVDLYDAQSVYLLERGRGN